MPQDHFIRTLPQADLCALTEPERYAARRRPLQEQIDVIRNGNLDRDRLVNQCRIFRHPTRERQNRQPVNQGAEVLPYCGSVFQVSEFRKKVIPHQRVEAFDISGDFFWRGIAIGYNAVSLEHDISLHHMIGDRAARLPGNRADQENQREKCKAKGHEPIHPESRVRSAAAAQVLQGLFRPKRCFHGTTHTSLCIAGRPGGRSG